MIDRAQLGWAIVGPRVLRREIGWLFPHIRNVTTQGDMRRRASPVDMAFEERVTS